MNPEETKKQPPTTNEPATVPDPAGGEEDIKDGEQGEDDLVDNMPDSHPAPLPANKS